MIADQWTDDVQLSDLEDKFTCSACGQRGAEVRPDFDLKMVRCCWSSRWLALFRENRKVLGHLIGVQKSFGGKPALQQVPYRRGSARHAVLKTPRIDGAEFASRQHDLKAIAPTKLTHPHLLTSRPPKGTHPPTCRSCGGRSTKQKIAQLAYGGFGYFGVSATGRSLRIFRTCNGGWRPR